MHNCLQLFQGGGFLRPEGLCRREPLLVENRRSACSSLVSPAHLAWANRSSHAFLPSKECRCTMPMWAKGSACEDGSRVTAGRRVAPHTWPGERPARMAIPSIRQAPLAVCRFAEYISRFPFFPSSRLRSSIGLSLPFVPKIPTNCCMGI